MVNSDMADTQLKHTVAHRLIRLFFSFIPLMSKKYLAIDNIGNQSAPLLISNMGRYACCACEDFPRMEANKFRIYLTPKFEQTDLHIVK